MKISTINLCDYLPFLEKLCVKFFNKNEQCCLNLSIPFLIKNNFFKLPKDIDEFKDAYFELTYKDGSSKRIDCTEKQNLDDEDLNKSIKYNKGIFEDSDGERLKYLNYIDQLIEETKNVNDEPINTKKNLIFFSVYFDNGYIDLFDLCLKTLHYHKFKNYDILIITDELTKKVIDELNILNFFNVHFLITDNAIDSSDASMKKCLLYNFEKIFDYEKIFLLDVDIMCVKNADIIFDIPIHKNQLYAARQLTLTSEDFRKKYHGFSCVPDSFIKHVEKTNQLPFNAGQFLFLNSKRMKNHFDNINKFMSEWTGYYFYEQCFLNYYFCRASMAMSTEMDRFVSFLVTHIR
jgi:FMN phosphatase YigB (HAD superfamily)